MTEISKIVRRSVPSIAQAIASLRSMRKELTKASTYTEIGRIIRMAEALQVLLGHIDEVKYEAQDTIIMGNRRIGEELNKVRAQPGNRAVTRLEEGKQGSGIPKMTRSRLQRLAGFSDAEIAQFSEQLRSDGHDVTVASILDQSNQEKAKSYRAARRKAFEDAPTLGEDAYEYRVGRAQDMLGDIKAGSVPLILTDPPYEEAADPLFGWLAEFAARVLAPGGSVIFFTGTYRLDRDFEIFKGKLRYWWQGILLHDKTKKLPGKFVIPGYKPVLWFVKDHRYNNEYVLDVLRSEGRDKDEHDWGQGEAGITSLIEALTEPGDRILDPFAGSGLWGRIAVANKRRWIGCDIIQGGSTEVVT